MVRKGWRVAVEPEVTEDAVADAVVTGDVAVVTEPQVPQGRQGPSDPQGRQALREFLVFRDREEARVPQGQQDQRALQE